MKARDLQLRKKESTYPALEHETENSHGSLNQKEDSEEHGVLKVKNRSKLFQFLRRVLVRSSAGIDTGISKKK